MYVLPYGQMSFWGKFTIYSEFINWLFIDYNNIIFNEKFLYLSIIPLSYSNNNDSSKIDEKFMAMFVGFIDGDGYFDIGSQKQYKKNSKLEARSTIRIRLGTNVNKRDLNTLLYFQRVLGVGTIDNKGTDQVRLLFYKEDLIQKIIPLMKKYNLSFLVHNRRSQFNLLEYIINNNITHWDSLDLNLINSLLVPPLSKPQDYINLSWFDNWLIGFTMSEGSFGFKNDNSAFYSIRQTGLENKVIIEAIQRRFGKDNEIKPDSLNSFKIAFSSKADIQIIVNFFCSNPQPLIGYKGEQYLDWVKNLSISKRYGKLNYPISNFNINLSTKINTPLKFTSTLAKDSFYKTSREPFKLFQWDLGILNLDLTINIIIIVVIFLFIQSKLCALNDLKFLNINSINLIYSSILPFIAPNTKSINRIGPHDYEIISILIGSLLGDAHAEKHGNGTRFCFQQEDSHSSYLLWFHKYLSELGYCNKLIPKITTRLGKNGRLRHISRFKTYTFSSFNWIHESFYENGIKVVPKNIGEYLSPLALAVWIQDDGGKVSSGLKIATNSFSFDEVNFLAKILRDKYDLKVSVNKAGAINQYCLYISKSSMKDLVEIIKPHLHPSMHYKLNGYI